MKFILDEERRKFIAHAVLNLGIAVFTIGLVNYFFERFPFAVRISLSVISVAFIFWSFFIYPAKRIEE